jgi:hypothetical protein
VRINFKAGALVAAASALAIAVPAAAHPSGSDHPNGTNHPNGANHPNASSHSSGSHGCQAHNVAYIVSGTIDSSQGTITVTNGTVSSGTLEVDVTRTNHSARKDKTASQPVAYQLGPDTKVKFDGGTTSFSAGERVKLIGKAPVVSNKHCSGAGTVGTPTFRMVVVHPTAS